MSILNLKKNILLAEGAMGTEFIRCGFSPPFEGLNLTHPREVQKLHRAYVEAGARLILTHSFGANPIRWKFMTGRDDFKNINAAAAQNTFDAVAEDAVVIAGNIGPTGLSGVSLDAVSDTTLEENFAEQADVLRHNGIKLFFLETFTRFRELLAALGGIKSSECIVCVSVNQDGSLSDGTPVEVWRHYLESAGCVSAWGVNCSAGPLEFSDTWRKISAAAQKPLVLKLNAGIPHAGAQNQSGYLEAQDYGSLMKPLLVSGVRIVGGCCGTNPLHIRVLDAICRGLS